MFRRRRIDWTATDWYGFFSVGGVLTVDAWERATPESRGACVLARQAMAGAAAPYARPGDPAPPEPARTIVDELKSIGARR